MMNMLAIRVIAAIAVVLFGVGSLDAQVQARVVLECLVDTAQVAAAIAGQVGARVALLFPVVRGFR